MKRLLCRLLGHRWPRQTGGIRCSRCGKYVYVRRVMGGILRIG